MRYYYSSLAALLIGGASTLSAQNPVQTVFEPCSHAVFTARQVQTPARFIGDTALSPRPVKGEFTAPNRVQFVVDTLGVPQPSSFKPLAVGDSMLIKRVKADLGRWRFSPAVASACKVPQLVVTTVVWR